MQKLYVKKVSHIFLMLLFMLGVVKLSAATYSGGSGTSGDPYQIATAADLITLSKTSSDWNSRYFIQTASITFNENEQLVDWDGDGTASWDAEDQLGFTPIGKVPSYFEGSYDGQNYIITNLYINRDATDFIALFGATYASTINNLGLVNINFTGADRTAGLVGYCNSSTISNCFSTGSVTGIEDVGGLIGNVSESSGDSFVSNCYSTTNASGTNYVGGLIGQVANAATISFSYAKGNASGNYAVGGFIGLSSGGGVVQNCYSTGNASRISGSQENMAGFIGACWNGTVQNCYSTGSVYFLVGSNPTTKGFVGHVLGGNTFSNNFFDHQASNQTSDVIGAATATTTANMKAEATFTGAGWDFSGDAETDWVMSSNITFNGYPTLKWTGAYTSEPVSNQIASVPNLVWLAENSSGWATSYTQTADINMWTTPSWDSNKGWTPIGNVTTKFTGNYDGGNFKLSNLYVNRSSTDNVGFFGYIGFSGPVSISNTFLVNSNITGNNYVGALSGNVKTSVINNCHVSGIISGSSYVGGLIGQIIDTDVSNSYSIVEVKGTGVLGFAGALIGLASDEDYTATPNYISKCFSSGHVVGVNATGGFIGAIVYYNVDNCYTTSNVERFSGSATYFGGFTSLIAYVIITNCYSTGYVKFPGETPEIQTDKGFAFLAEALFTNCFWDTESSGATSSAGQGENLVGKTTAQMKAQSTFTDWDFTSGTGIWSIENGVDWWSYPYLQAIDYDIPFAKPAVNPIPGFEGPLNPSSFALSVVSTTEIDLSWTLFRDVTPVLLAYNTTSTFGNPTGTYTAGNTITGGGTVLYVGSNTSFNHTPINVNKHYYYKIWSKNGVNYYSNGQTGDKWTLANVPSAPTVNNPTATTLDVKVNVNGNPNSTEFVIHETSTDKYVQADGTLGASAVWATAATWGTKTLTGLTTATVYTFEVKARNGDNVETLYSTSTDGTPIDKPVVTTQAVNLIAETSATGNGNITNTNGDDANLRGVILYLYSDTDKTMEDEDVTNFEEEGNFGTGTYTFTLSPLTSNTRYNARAHATNSNGTAYGSRVDFWTLSNVPDAPTVGNATATTLDVTVNANGNPTSTEFAIHESTTDKFVQANGTLGASAVWATATTWGTKTLISLTTGTTYTFEVKARNGGSVETVYGLSTDGTPVAKPVVTTQAVSLIEATSASGNGTITSTNGDDVTNRGIILYPYTNTDKEIAEAEVTNFDADGTFGTGTFTFTLSPITPNTRYNARAHATNTHGTAYGARVDYWTLANVPAAPTVDNPTATSLDVSVNANSNPESTKYVINETSTTKFVQADGTLNTTEVWQTATEWGTTTVTGLSTGVTYTFKVKARNENNVETAYSDGTSKNTCSNPTDGGEIDGTQTICYNTEAAVLGSVSEASNYGGSLEYQWQSSTQSSVAGFSDIIGAATNTYSPGAMTQTSWFKRLARVGCKDDWTGAAESNIIKITVDPATESGTITGSENIIVHTTTGDLTLTGQTGDVLQWEKKLDAGSWEIIPGTATSTYSETPETVGAWTYRALVQSGLCSSTYTAGHVIEVTPAEPDYFTLTSPGTAITGSASGNFVISLFDQYDNPTYCRSNTTFNLSTSSNSSSHIFTPGSPLQLLSGTYSNTFTYTDTKTGTHNITATYVSGASGLTGETLTVPITITLLVPWAQTTIGASNGTTEFFPEVNGGTYKQTAQGLSAPKSDVMNFVYQPLCGNGTVIARLSDVVNGGWAGVMMRESNAPGAKTVLFKTKLYNPMANIGVRSTTNGNISNTNQNLPSLRWMKIQRTNASTFVVYMSYDGTSWIKRHTATVAMNNCINAGFFTENAVSGRTTSTWIDHAEIVGYLKDTEEVNVEINEPNQFEVNVYPNPANDRIWISIAGNEEKIKVSLINASGLVVETTEMNTMDAEYQLSHIKAGLYLLRFERNGIIVSKRLVVL